SPDADDGIKVGVRLVKINALEFISPDIKLPIVDVEALTKEGSQLESAIIKTVDGTLTAKLTAERDTQRIAVSANKWTLPVGLPLLIDSAIIEAQLKDNRLDVSKMDVALYSGKLTGDAVLTWDKSWKMNGKLKVESLAVKEPSRLASKSVYLSGDLFGNGNFSSTAKEAAGLTDNLRADFKFNVNKGVLHGLDLVKLASLIVKQSQGGMTEFNEFSGVLHAAGKQYHLRDIKMSSGLLAAKGQVKVRPNKQLNGAIEAEIKNSASLATIPLEVSGTVSNPVVLPSKAALAGAIAGTAILGPGVGTSLGVKAGDAVGKLKGLFGGE
ncbi:MAG: AsmA family protein, partial [Methylophilaceae bacterium]